MRSITTRTGLMPDVLRTVSLGLSVDAVPAPTMTASDTARKRCRWVMPSSPLMNLEAPVTVAIRPSDSAPSGRQPASASLEQPGSTEAGKLTAGCVRRALLAVEVPIRRSGLYPVLACHCPAMSVTLLRFTASSTSSHAVFLSSAFAAIPSYFRCLWIHYR